VATELQLHRTDVHPTIVGGGFFRDMPLEPRSGALMLLAADLEVLFCNRAAAEIAEARQGVCIRAGRLALTDADRHERLIEAAASLTRSSLPFDRLEPVILFLRPARDAAAMQLVVEACAPAGARGGSVLLVSLHTPQRTRRISRGFLARAFHLTASEAEVVVQLFDGLSIPVVSARLGVSINTVKTHLKNVFMKCEVRSQGELIKLVALGPWLA
jgi:DNA-binding CsgD family transcriptional regulator